MPEKNNSVTVMLINFLTAKGLWNGYDIYTFGDAGAIKVKPKPGASEKEPYLGERGSHISKRGMQVTIKRNSKLLWNQARVEKIDYGNLVHELLKQIVYTADIEKVLSKMLNEGVFDATLKTQLQKEITDLLDLGVIGRYFEPPYKVMNERALMDSGSTNIPDRVVTYANNCVIIDYKTGTKRNEDIVQMREYMGELKKFGFDEVKGYLLYTGDKSIIEV